MTNGISPPGKLHSPRRWLFFALSMRESVLKVIFNLTDMVVHLILLPKVLHARP